jgi:dTDP-4-amino-4,6-dideoxygalactose transaminase
MQVALKLVGDRAGDVVIRQALTFVAISNAIACNGASPIF